MSLPPLRPEKTAAGIIVDPRTLERVVPSSKRNDGTTRKERKIRPGFTPTEDIGRFRPAASSSSKPTFIPGSNRVKPAVKPDGVVNPFARVDVGNEEKSKAQLKNEKRRAAAKVRKAVEAEVGGGGEGEGRDWDDDGDEAEEGVGGLREAFESVDLKSSGGRDTKVQEGDIEVEGQVGEAGGAPAAGVITNASNGDGDGSGGESVGLEILGPTPGSGITSANEIITPTIPNTNSQPTDTNPLTSTGTKTQPKPHPIQGGRKGPIGLANPPPIPSPTPKPSDNSTWRKNGMKSGGNGGKRNGNAGKGGGGMSGVELLPTPVPPEVRVRKEVKVRQGGANDLSSLASRVRGLVLENEKGRSSPKKGGEKEV